MQFNEDSRVKIPAILHLVRLGYDFLSLKDQEWDKKTNIFKSNFLESIRALNPQLLMNGQVRVSQRVKEYKNEREVLMATEGKREYIHPAKIYLCSRF